MFYLWLPYNFIVLLGNLLKLCWIFSVIISRDPSTGMEILLRMHNICRWKVFNISATSATKLLVHGKASRTTWICIEGFIVTNAQCARKALHPPLGFATTWDTIQGKGSHARDVSVGSSPGEAMWITGELVTKGLYQCQQTDVDFAIINIKCKWLVV